MFPFITFRIFKFPGVDAAVPLVSEETRPETCPPPAAVDPNVNGPSTSFQTDPPLLGVDADVPSSSNAAPLNSREQGSRCLSTSSDPASIPGGGGHLGPILGGPSRRRSARCSISNFTSGRGSSRPSTNVPRPLRAMLGSPLGPTPPSESDCIRSCRRRRGFRVGSSICSA